LRLLLRSRGVVEDANEAVRVLAHVGGRLLQRDGQDLVAAKCGHLAPRLSEDEFRGRQAVGGLAHDHDVRFGFQGLP